MTSDLRALPDPARAWLASQLRWERALERLRRRNQIAGDTRRNRPAA